MGNCRSRNNAIPPPTPPRHGKGDVEELVFNDSMSVKDI